MRDLIDWATKHMKAIVRKPTNGHSATAELDRHLDEINRRKRALNRIVDKIEADTQELKKIAMEEGSVKNS